MGSIDSQKARNRRQGESDSVIEAGRFQHFGVNCLPTKRYGNSQRRDEVQGSIEVEGRKLLAESVLLPAESLADAAQKAVAAAQAR